MNMRWTRIASPVLVVLALFAGASGAASAGATPWLASSTARALPAVEQDGLANDDTASTDEDTPVDIPVLANDDGDATVDAIGTAPTHGSASINGDGTIAYTPDADFNGSDSFTYSVIVPVDGGEDLTDTATVDVTVNPVNDTPVAEDDADDTDEDVAVDIDVLANDTDVEGDIDPTTVAVDTAPANGSTSVDAVTGVVTYTPDADFNGSDSFTYTVDDLDGATSNAATVEVIINPVNDTPVAEDDAGDTDVDTAIDIDVVANDSDVDGIVDATTVVVDTAPSDGTVDIDAVSGVATYTPDAGFIGADSFTYTANDDLGETSNVATVTVVVGPHAELSIAKTADEAAPPVDADPDAPAEPTEVTFTIEVTNNGPHDTTGVVVSDVLPAGLTYVSDDGAGSYDDTTGEWAVGDLANGATATLHIVAMRSPNATATNTATIIASSATDTDDSDDSASADVGDADGVDFEGCTGASHPAFSVICRLLQRFMGSDNARESLIRVLEKHAAKVAPGWVKTHGDGDHEEAKAERREARAEEKAERHEARTDDFCESRPDHRKCVNEAHDADESAVSSSTQGRSAALTAYCERHPDSRLCDDTSAQSVSSHVDDDDDEDEHDDDDDEDEDDDDDDDKRGRGNGRGKRGRD